jgi:uncharacterized integral membrane protein
MNDQTSSTAVSSVESSIKPISIPKRVAVFLGVKGALIVSVMMIVTIFCLQNIESTSVQFLFWKILEVPKLYLVAISLFLGIGVGLLLGWCFNSATKKLLSW